MPSLAELRAQLHRNFELRSADGLDTSAELVDAWEGVAMSARYVCYSALFVLPSGTYLPQAVYAVNNGSAEWPLLLVPVLPGSDGQARMEAVFHVPLSNVAAGAKPVAVEECEPTGSLVSN